MTKQSNTRPQTQLAASHADQRDRVARLRDTAGRFTKAEVSEPVTLESSASLNFEAVELGPDVPLRSDRDWIERIGRHAVGFHIADRLIRMGKAEAVSFCGEFLAEGEGVFGALLDTICAAHDEAKGLVDLMSAAEARFMIAASALAVSSKAEEA